MLGYVMLCYFSETSKSILFCKEGTTYDEKWEGSRIGETCMVYYWHLGPVIYLHALLLAGFREAVTFMGMDEAAPLSSLDSYVYDFIKINSKVNSIFCLLI